MCLLSSGFSESPTAFRSFLPASLHLSTLGLVLSIPFLIFLRSSFCFSMAFGSIAGGSWELRFSWISFNWLITFCNSSQNFSARARASSRDFERFLVPVSISFHKSLSLSSFFLISLIAGSFLLGALSTMSLAAFLTAL